MPYYSQLALALSNSMDLSAPASAVSLDHRMYRSALLMQSREGKGKNIVVIWVATVVWFLTFFFERGFRLELKLSAYGVKLEVMYDSSAMADDQENRVWNSVGGEIQK
jgi:hypothetical protein